MKITSFLDCVLSYLAETNPRREHSSNACNLNKGFCHRSYSFWRNCLNGLSLDLQPSESGNVERERKDGLLVYASIYAAALLSL